MRFIENQLYHIYNQGNNRERIFFSRENQLYFLKGFRKFVLPHCQLLAYCLMPNHFHFMVNTIQSSSLETKIGGISISALSNGFRKLLSSYTQAINKQQQRSGSLFRQRTKAKLLDEKDDFYPFICFHYIHQNPMKAGLVEKMEDWEFSSFQDYIERRNGTLCDIDLAYKLLGLSKGKLYEESYQVITKEKINNLY